MTHLERFNAIQNHQPGLAHQFVGWMTGTAARAERDPSHRPSVLAEVERFLASYEAEILVGKPKSDAIPTPSEASPS